MTAQQPDEGQPTDRALHHLARPLTGCSALVGRDHAPSCPGSHGADDDLEPSKEAVA